MESEIPILVNNKHYLDQISDFGYYKTIPLIDESNHKKVSTSNELIKKTSLNCTVSIMDLSNIDAMAESFCVKYRLYMMWEISIADFSFINDYAKQARINGHYYSLNRHEFDHFAENYCIPKVSLFNSLEIEEIDLPDIRVYGGELTKTAIMWNCGYKATCKELFELKNFPYDVQVLTLEFRLNCPKTWDLYDLTINTLQFNKSALQLTEWKPFTPILKRENPRHKVSKVSIQVQRLAGFYIQNVACMMFFLSLLSLSSFSVDLTDNGSRISINVTLILTAVAFKFILANTLPKVPYNTLIDYYILWCSGFLALMNLLIIIPSFFNDNPDLAVKINTILAWICFFVIVSSFLCWISYAELLTRKKIQANEIVLGKANWYSFRFSNPPFFDVPIEALNPMRHRISEIK